MLIFMLLNTWLCVAILLGAGSGFLIFHFRPLKTRLFNIIVKGKNCAERHFNNATVLTSYTSFKQREEWREREKGINERSGVGSYTTFKEREVMGKERRDREEAEEEEKQYEEIDGQCCEKF